MIDAISTLFGNASLMRRMRGAHHSSVLSEISSQFHDEWSAAPGRFFIETLRVVGSRAHELRLRAVDVDDGMESDRLRDHSAPTGVERAQ